MQRDLTNTTPSHNACNYEDGVLSLEERGMKASVLSLTRGVQLRYERKYHDAMKKFAEDKERQEKLRLDFNNGNEWPIVKKVYRGRYKSKNPDFSRPRYKKFPHAEIYQNEELKGVTGYELFDDEAIEVSTPIRLLTNILQ